MRRQKKTRNFSNDEVVKKRNAPKSKDFKEKQYRNLPPIQPKNASQEQYQTALENDELVIGVGAAGTGKTYLASSYIADMYASGKLQKIIITRPTVPCGDDLGHLPGELAEKFEPWTLPVINTIKQRIGHETYECAIKNENIQVIPMQFMRGLSFDDAGVIIDEAQNMTIEQAKMALTRIGHNSKLIINGDTSQTDLDDRNSGLGWLVSQLQKQQVSGVEIVRFTWQDCVRSSLCKRMLQMIEKAG